MRERGIKFVELAECLGISVKEARERVNTRNVRLEQLVELLDILGLDLYPILRGRYVL